MLKLLLIALTLLAFNGFAQEAPRDLEFIETQNTQAMPFNIPVYLDLEGNLNILFNKSEMPISFRVNTQVAWNNATSLYIKPIKRQGFAFLNQKDGLEWIQVRRKRWEFGLGLGVLTNKLPFSLGLSPYKGSRMIVTRNLLNPTEKLEKPKLPKTLEEIKSWRVGDTGSFQTYGGVHVLLGASMGVSMTAGVTFQSLFGLVVSRLADNKVQLSIAEENLNKRRLQANALVATATYHLINGKRLTSHFTFDLNDESHKRLFALAIKGKLSDVQEELSSEAQMLIWKGEEKIGYYGIPGVAGKYSYRSEYVMKLNGEEDTLDVESRRNSGIFVPMRNYNNLVYQTQSAVTLYWFAEMNKANQELLAKKFLNPGKIMGAQGFEQTIPAGSKIGSTLSQMGISFTKEELANVSPELLNEVLTHYLTRCQEMKLSCAEEKEFVKVEKKLKGFLGKNWVDIRDQLGFVLIEQPALIYAYIKAIKSKKKIYYKFMNQTYQSLEGSAAIEI